MDTFVVRLWSPGAPNDGAGSGAGLRGTAQHVASGHSAPFRSGLQLLDLLAELRGLSADASAASAAHIDIDTDPNRDPDKEHSS